jgi:hypothetical protein
MKIKALILLILIVTTTFLYNVVGGHLLVSFQKEQKWVNKMQKTSNYKILKLNASIYTFVDDADFENINENITLNHKVYHVFKKKIQDNILYLYYLPNKLETEKTIGLKKMIDSELFENNGLNKKPLEKLFKSFIKDYVFTTNYDLNVPKNFNFSVVQQYISLTKTTFSGFLRLAFSPPKLV